MTPEITTYRLDSMDKKIDDMYKESKDFHVEILHRFDELEKKFESKYAWKWTEKILIFIWWTIWTILIGALMAMIIIKS